MSGVTLSSLAALVALGVLCGGIAYVTFIYLVTRTGAIFTSLSHRCSADLEAA